MMKSEKAGALDFVTVVQCWTFHSMKKNINLSPPYGLARLKMIMLKIAEVKSIVTYIN